MGPNQEAEFTDAIAPQTDLVKDAEAGVEDDEYKFRWQYGENYQGVF